MFLMRGYSDAASNGPLNCGHCRKCGRSKSDTCEGYPLNWCSQLTVGDVEGKLKSAIKRRDIVVWRFLIEN